MRKVELRMKEDYSYEIIKQLVETDGNLLAASVKLNCSKRTIYRWIHAYKTHGKKAFVHKNRGRKPGITKNPKIKAKLIELYKKDYPDCNFKHFTEIVKEDFDLSLSDSTLNRWLRKEYILSPKAKRATKK